MQVSACFLDHFIHDHLVQGIHPWIIELRSNRSVNRHVIHIGIPQVMVALVLFADIAQCIECSAFVEFIQGNHVGKVQHVDFF